MLHQNDALILYGIKQNKYRQQIYDTHILEIYTEMLCIRNMKSIYKLFYTPLISRIYKIGRR